MAEYAILDADGTIINVIVADQEFIDSLESQINDVNVDSGSMILHSPPILIEDIEGTDRPGLGWKKNGSEWEKPAPPPTVVSEPTPVFEDVVLANPTLSGLSAAEKAAVAKAIRQAQGRGPN
jgi:hypothetical protein